MIIGQRSNEHGYAYYTKNKYLFITILEVRKYLKELFKISQTSLYVGQISC